MASKRQAALFALVGLVLGGLTYQRVNTAQLNLPTGLLFIATAWVCLFLIVELASMARALSAYKRHLQVLVVTLGMLAFGTELYLRSKVPTLRTYYENNGETTYRTLSNNTGPTWFHVHPANHDLTWTTSEFVHARHTNHLGLSEREIPLQKAPHEYRVIALGDSFTEGVGVDYESTWVKVVERRLAERMPDRVVTTFNAGISGSDVFFEYMLLKEKLVKYAPDLVILAINTSDIDDIMIRGGMERFQPDGTYRSPHEPPRWEWLYGISYVTRLVVHGALGYDHLFLKRSRHEVDRRNAVDKMRSLLPSFSELGSKHGFRLAVVFQPTGTNAAFRTYGDEIPSLIDDLRRQKAVEVVDVLARWSATGQPAPDDWLKLYWPTDNHHNAKGYAVLGATIADSLFEPGSEGP